MVGTSYIKCFKLSNYRKKVKNKITMIVREYKKKEKIKI